MLVLIVVAGWMIPVAIYAFTLKMRSKYERRITKLCSIINLSNRERYISELGEVVAESTPRPVLLERFLPERDEPATDRDYYEFFHNQFLFQSRNSPAARFYKIGWFDLIYSVGFLFLAVLPLFFLSFSVWLALLIYTVPLILLITTFIWMKRTLYDCYEREIGLLDDIDKQFADLVGAGGV